jgi:hypothetical protein
MNLNNNQLEFCNKLKITSRQFLGEDVIENYLNLSGIREIPEGFKPRVNDSINLLDIILIPPNFSPHAKGYIYADAIRDIPLNFKPHAGKSIFLRGAINIGDGFEPTAGDNIFINSANISIGSFKPYVEFGNLVIGRCPSGKWSKLLCVSIKNDKKLKYQFFVNELVEGEIIRLNYWKLENNYADV